MGNHLLHRRAKRVLLFYATDLMNAASGDDTEASKVLLVVQHPAVPALFA